MKEATDDLATAARDKPKQDARNHWPEQHISMVGPLQARAYRWKIGNRDTILLYPTQSRVILAATVWMDRDTGRNEAMRVRHEAAGSNLADILSKCLDGPGHRRLISHILRQVREYPL